MPGMMEKAMESVEYTRAVTAMSEVMANAEEEARDFVAQKAEELGEEGAFQAALMEAFVAFDSDDDGLLLGKEAAVLLEVSGRSVSEELRQELETKGYECDFETFAGLYERSEPLASSPDDEDEDL
ncbi:unnamed protein product [Effrenium voratum]|nr:unnamed protein product [Effrenium voratum]CAJ1459719.1 unnamed protein product [Effrenium voratum]